MSSEPPAPGFVSDGMVTTISRYGVSDLVGHLVEFLQANDVTVFAQIDHATNAASVGLSMRPTVLLIFGNPAVGTELMLDRQEIGLDLPLKALVWEDENGETWLTYDDGLWLAKRHRLGPHHDATLQAIETFMSSIARAATQA